MNGVYHFLRGDFDVVEVRAANVPRPGRDEAALSAHRGEARPAYKRHAEAVAHRDGLAVPRLFYS
jgi:hypothetical protein